MLRFVAAPHLFRLDPSSTGRLLFDTFVAVGQALLMPILLFFAVALLAGLVQNGFLFAPKELEMKLEKLSPICGLKRLFSMSQLVRSEEPQYELKTLISIPYHVFYLEKKKY